MVHVVMFRQVLGTEPQFHTQHITQPHMFRAELGMLLPWQIGSL